MQSQLFGLLLLKKEYLASDCHIIGIISMLRKICCLDTDLCKCSCLGLTRNKNVKLGYIFVLLLAFGILIFVNILMHPESENITKGYGCHEDG